MAEWLGEPDGLPWWDFDLDDTRMLRVADTAGGRVALFVFPDLPRVTPSPSTAGFPTSPTTSARSSTKTS